ncbi:MAG: branched-chain amino acid ABC transporter permease [Fimbriimonadaceae bacterium]|nr:branched-chain amino acid ABC transporter permease [Alphaproteobacteria bacterium]
MFYREAGQFKTSYRADQAVFPIRQDVIGIWLLLGFMFLIVPFTFNDFWLNSVMIPVLIFSLATIGLNILTGYAGQISLGTGGFMGVGAYSCYKLASIFPDVNILIHILLSGLFAAGVGVFFGLPSLRIKGFYLTVATLASQFFLEWAFGRVPWLYNYNPSGAIEVPTRTFFDIPVTGPYATSVTRYVIVLTIVVCLTWVASNIIRGKIGRTWMAVRDMDIAAELIGIRLLNAKLTAFAISSYFAGVAGALMVFMWLGAAEVESFDINHSFLILFMVVIGGGGSLIGSFMGATFLWVLPIMLRGAPQLFGFDIGGATVEHFSFMITGGLIIFFLIVEPHGFARLWQLAKQKLRRWPFPY